MSFGASANKSSGTTSGTSTYNKNSTGSTTATLPDWLNTVLQNGTQKSVDLANADPTSYVAGADPLQAKAAEGAAGLTGSPWNFDTAADLTRGVAAGDAPKTAGVTADGFMGKYVNPWLKSVVDATSSDLDRSDNLSRQQFDLQNADAFGGSGLSLAKSETEGALSRARAAQLGGLRSQGFDTALGAAQADAARQQSVNDTNAGLAGQQQDRRLAAGRQLADVSTAYDANQRANIGTQGETGAMMQGIAQKFAQAPLELQSWLKDNLSPLLQGLFGQNTTGTEAGNEASTGKSSGTSFGFSAATK